MTENEVKQLYSAHISKRNKDNLPYQNSEWLPNEIVVDKRALSGLINGKNSLDFAKDGSLVKNEDKRFRFSLLRKAYLEKKYYETFGTLSNDKCEMINVLNADNIGPIWSKSDS
jgi:hypothetical protein